MSHLQYTAKSHLRNFKTRIFRDEQADIFFNSATINVVTLSLVFKLSSPPQRRHGSG